MKKLLLLLTVAAASCLAQGGYAGPGRYSIVNVKSNQALEASGNYVVQSNRNGSRSQIWTVSPAGRGGLVTIQNEMRGCALTLGGRGNSTPVRCTSFRQTPNQLWSLQPARDGSLLVVAQNGKVLDIPNGSNSSGTRVQTYDRNGENNQRFFFQRAGGRPGPGFGPGNGTITCTSDNGRRRVCPADTSRGVILVREYNRGACVQGRTWGYDRNGIWVDRGCSADFRIGR
jgi:hypothetical protein